MNCGIQTELNISLLCLWGALATLPSPALPAVDLTPTEISASATVDVGRNLQVAWKAANLGEAAAMPPWYDQVYLSTDPEFDSRDRQLGQRVWGKPLATGDNYSSGMQVAIPKVAPGQYYLFVLIDGYNNVDENNEYNNVSEPRPIRIQAPDLRPKGLSAPAAVDAGQSIQVGWQVTNSGDAQAAGSWCDTIYLSTDEQVSSDDLQLNQNSQTQLLSPNSGYASALGVTLPKLPPGRYYLLVEIDTFDSIFEGNSVNNLLAKEIQICVPDLQPTTFTAPDVVDAGQAVQMAWEVTNAGDGRALPCWYDRIYLSTDDQLDEGDQQLDENAWTQTVAPSTSYSCGVQTTAPNLPPGQYFLFFETDAYHTLFDSNPANNLTAAKPIQIRVPDLNPTVFTAPEIAGAGETIQITWEVANNGDAPVLPPWYDRVYLSTDDHLDSGDLQLGQEQWNQIVLPGESYASGLQVTLPSLPSGEYYLFVEIDAFNLIFETSHANNRTAGKRLLIRTPELEPKSLTAPAIVDAGQSVTVAWEAINRGDGEAKGPWQDRLYLSADDKLDRGDRQLEQALLTEAVPAGGTYSCELQATLPNLAPGEYYLFLRIDADNGVPETDELNNVLPAQQVTIRVPDLQPLRLLAPVSADPGEIIQLVWETQNFGNTEARVPWYDRLYLSADDTLDTEDLVLAETMQTNSIPAGSNDVERALCAVPNLPWGPYHLILVSDSSNHVYEISETNNTQAQLFWVGPKPPPLMALGKGKTETPKDVRFNAPSGTRRVEYRLNGTLISTSYGPGFSLGFDDPLIQAETRVLPGTNVIVATAFGNDDAPLCTGTLDWPAWSEGNYTETEILEPRRSLEVYADGATSKPFGMRLRVRAARQFVRSPEEGGGIAELPMPKVSFYIDDELVHESTNATPGDELVHEYYYYTSGLERGRHLVRAVSIPGEGFRESTDSVSLYVTNGYPELSVSREVSQHGTWFSVTLTIRNTGNEAAVLKRLEEVVTGFQIYAVQSDWVSDAPAISYDALDKQSKFEVLFPNPSRLTSNEVCTVSYRAVPILFRTDTEYAFGGGGGIEFAELNGTAHTHSPLLATATITSLGRSALSDAVTAAFRNCDYLLVTSPAELETCSRPEGLVQVLTNMAELAGVRGGVLAYYDRIARIRTSFRPGDLVSQGLVFRRGDGRDQLFIGGPDDDTIRCIRATGELADGDLLPIRLNSIGAGYDLRLGDAMLVGPLLEAPGWWEGRSEIFVAPLGGSPVYVYIYNPDAGLIGRDVWDVRDFFQPGDAIVLGDVIEEPPDRRAKEVIIAKATGEIRMYQYGRYSQEPGLTFTSAFRNGDLLAAGCLLGYWHDEIVIGDMDDNRLRVYVLNDSGSGFKERATLNMALEPGDAIAIGDVCGDSRDEIVLVDASEGRAHVYANTVGFNFTEVATFALSFENGDRLAVACISSGNKAAILHLSGHDRPGCPAGTMDIIQLGPGEAPGDKWDLDQLLNKGGLWAGQLSTNWTQSGFLLLVGEDEVVPAFTANWDLAWSDHGSVAFTDRNYASTGDDADWPELSLGRIPGSSAESLSTALRTAIEVAQNPGLLENRSAYCVSGSRRGPKEDYDDINFAAGREVAGAILRGRGFDPVFEEDQPSLPKFFVNAADRDVIFLAGHGSADACDIVGERDIAARFEPGTKRPLVYAFSCLTGRYPQGWSLAERFLQNGASSFVGSTEVQGSTGEERGWGPRYAEAFLSRLQADRPLGMTWRETVRARLRANTWPGDDEWNAYHCATIHFFGDPKATMLWSRPTPTSADEPVLDPAPEISVSIPMYTVRKSGNEDLIEIPGQDEQVLEAGQPVLPAYVANISFPRGQEVQSVSLNNRSEPTPGPSLSLPITQLAIAGGSGGSGTNEAGWWPDVPYAWQASKNPDGSTTLRIIAYAIQATNRSEIRFFSNFVFGVEYTPSQVEIQRLAMERPVYHAGAIVAARVSLLNLSTPQDVSVSARVTSSATRVSEEFALPLLRHASGLAQAGIQWDSAGKPDGSYNLRVFIRNTEGLLFDEASADFQVVQARGTISTASVSPATFQYGDRLDLSAVFLNAGSATLDGTINLSIQDAAGASVAEFKQPFTALAAGKSIRATATWTNATLSPRNCRVLVYADFGGQTTPVTLVGAWEQQPLHLELAGAQNGLLSFQWYSVAGRRYTLEFTSDLTQAFTPLNTPSLATPPINTFQHTPISPAGFYRLREQR